MTEVKKQKRQFWVIIAIVFLGFIGISMPYLIFPALFLNPEYYILPASASSASRALFLGVTLAAYPFGQFIGSPILGALSDDYGRKKFIWSSLLVSAVCYLFTGFAILHQMLGLLIICRFVAGLMEGNIAVARAMAADLKTISKHSAFGKINAAISIAFLMGPLLGGLMSDKRVFESFTPSTPFYFICILFFCLAGVSAIMLEKEAAIVRGKVKTVWQRLNLIKRMAALFVNRELRFLMITSSLFTLAVDIFYEFGPVYLTVKWTLGPSQLIVYNAILCLALAIGNGWLSQFFPTSALSKWAVICSLGGLAFFLIPVVSVNSTFWMLVLMGLIGLVIGLAVTLLTVKISDSASGAIQGEVLGTQLSLRVLGDAIICLFGGALLLISPKIILIVAAAISLSAMLYYARKVRIKQN